MASTRSVKNPGIFAGDALTTIPAVPVQGVSYRDAATGVANIAAGWPFGIKVNSAEWNQVMFQLTTLMGILDSRGILGYTNLVDYTVGSLVIGSDNLLYTCIQNNGPGSTPRDPAANSSPAHWRTLVPPAAGTTVLTAASGNFIVPANVFTIEVEGWGAGAGGGGIGSAGGVGGGGGGAGGYFRAVLSVTPGQSIAYAVGAGGTGGGAGAAGGNGGSTTFGAFTATGGIGGRPNDTGNGGTNGTASGSGALLLTGGGAGFAASSATGGAGGAASFGGAGGGAGVGPGGAGQIPGAGGAGRGPASVGAGANGADGRIIISYGA